MNLSSIRVLDLSRLLPGPYATQLLAESGADVIKVEDTDKGDYSRTSSPTGDDNISFLFNAINRGKRSICLDLSSQQGQEVFYDLVEDADVIFEQFRPGVVDRLGINYEQVQPINSDIIYCSLTGYGQNGPYCDRPGHDLNYAATAGLLDMTREDRSDKPQIPGIPVADMSGGLFAAFSIVSALLSRELGGTSGEYIDVSMTDVLLSFSQLLIPKAIIDCDVTPGRTRLTGKYPCYDIYKTSDQRYIALAALEPKFWQNFCKGVGKEELIDKHMSESAEVRSELRSALEEIFASKTREEWADEMMNMEAMISPVNTILEAIENPQIASRNLIDYDEKPYVRSPGMSSEEFSSSRMDAPKHGQHTDDVLNEIGYTKDTIDNLRENDIIN